jgi:hypothetical protein
MQRSVFGKRMIFVPLMMMPCLLGQLDRVQSRLARPCLPVCVVVSRVGGYRKALRLGRRVLELGGIVFGIGSCSVDDASYAFVVSNIMRAIYYSRAILTKQCRIISPFLAYREHLSL